jgi:tetratricopeptide (TPR) repeat protein
LADDRFVDTVAHHYAAAADLVAELGSVSGIGSDVTESALRWVGEAARRAETGQVLPVAVRLFGQALRLAGGEHPELRVAFLLGRARASSELRELDQAERDIAEAVDLATAQGDEVGLAQADLVLGELVQRRGDAPLALEILGRATDRFRRLDHHEGMADTLRATGMTLLFHGQLDEAEVVISEALDTSRQVDDRRGEAWAVQQLAWISFVTGRAVEAERRLEHAAEIFEGIGDWAGLASARGLLAYAMFQQGRLEEAAELGDEILVTAHERGDVWGEGMMYVLAASVRLWLGRAGEAIGRAEAAVELLGRLGDRFGEVNAHAVLGRSLLAVGRIDEGFDALAEGAGVLRGEADEGLASLGLTALAGAATQLGEPHRADAALAALNDEWVARTDATAVERLVALGVAHLQCGRVAEARLVLDRATSFDLGESPSSYALAGLALARAACGDVDEVLALDKQVNDMDRATYLDQGTAKLAAILVRARRGDADAGPRFEAVVRAADRTDDRVAQAVARLTRAYGLEALGVAEASDARAEAEHALDEIGIDAPGWRNAIEVILAAKPDAASTEPTPSSAR